jgi:hypothetical protein
MAERGRPGDRCCTGLDRVGIVVVTICLNSEHFESKLQLGNQLELNTEVCMHPWSGLASCGSVPILRRAHLCTSISYRKKKGKEEIKPRGIIIPRRCGTP